jgi:predicted membrane protein|tara:strand:- start:79 stop:477 length:399 start_codon:yes stop_codon:yes gene_type:complete
MQLLFEEIFRKIYGLSTNKSPLSLKIIIRLILFLLIVVIFGLVLYLVFTKKYIVFVILFGLIIIGEIAHYLRKNREKVMNDKLNQRKGEKKKVREIVKPVKSKNKSLLGSKDVKNDKLLKGPKSKNKNLLKK